MTNKFGGLLGENMVKALGSLNTPRPNFKLPVADKRSRTERREDFEDKIKAIDKEAILELKKSIVKISDYEEESKDEFWDHKDEVENALIKILRYYDEFEDLNSEESRKVGLKEQELKLEAKHDWADKSRLFFFRVLATILFVSSLFAIGYIEHNYEWAKLPMSKYIKTVPQSPLK